MGGCGGSTDGRTHRSFEAFTFRKHRMLFLHAAFDSLVSLFPEGTLPARGLQCVTCFSDLHGCRGQLWAPNATRGLRGCHNKATHGADTPPPIPLSP